MPHDNKNDIGHDILQTDRTFEPLSSLTLDPKRYDHLLGNDLTPEQKHEFLQTLWTIMVCFVDLGFGLDPTQATCGKLLQIIEDNTLEALDSVDLEQSPYDGCKKSLPSERNEGEEGFKA
ncbi:MAG: hypothetical protein H6858_03305 [Rhodospirillales bacterium]|nr:hypothetical protein [Rhodospirillales bacterium]